jgi:hypothetical protein
MQLINKNTNYSIQICKEELDVIKQALIVYRQKLDIEVACDSSHPHDAIAELILEDISKILEPIIFF